MTRARPQVLSLNGGEVDDEIIARSDIDSYANKAAVYENAVPAVKGGLFRAPGTEFLARTMPGVVSEDMAAVVRSWRFSRSQAFTLEIGHTRMRFAYGSGYVQAGSGAGVFGSSWTDNSTGGASASESEPTWPAPPTPPPAPSVTTADNPYNQYYDSALWWQWQYENGLVDVATFEAFKQWFGYY